jgi:hypothetical protein
MFKVLDKQQPMTQKIKLLEISRNPFSRTHFRVIHEEEEEEEEKTNRQKDRNTATLRMESTKHTHRRANKKIKQKTKKTKTRERYPIRCGVISTNEAAAELMEPVPPITRM